MSASGQQRTKTDIVDRRSGASTGFSKGSAATGQLVSGSGRHRLKDLPNKCTSAARALPMGMFAPRDHKVMLLMMHASRHYADEA